MKTHELEKLIFRAVHEAIEKMGIEAFKKTSFFMSSHASVALKKAA